MNRHSEMVTSGAVSIETYVDGNGPPSSSSRPTAETAVMTSSRSRPLTPATASYGPSRVVDDLGDDIAHVIDQLGQGSAVVLGHAFGRQLHRPQPGTNHPGRPPAAILAAAAGRTASRAYC